jgi:chromosomal replication initiator protein
MKKLAEDRNIILPAEVIDHLLVHVRRELPPLIYALERIHRHSLATSRRISVRLAREALQI